MDNIPKEIKIGNRIITVEFENFEDGFSAMGFYDPNNFRIVINADLKANNPTQIIETFWHELVHAIFDSIRFSVELQMEMDDNDPVAEDAFKIEERTTENFARTFLQVIQDNDLLPIVS